MKSLKTLTYFGVLILMLLFSNNSASQTTYNISSPEELEDQTYAAGDIIILANGVYDSDERIDFIGNGTADSPITFRAESAGGVVFTGGLKMNIGGDYVVVDGFHWKGGYGASNFIQFRNGYDYANHSTIQNCAIDGLAIHPDDIADDVADGSITKHRWIVLYGTYNTVINCSFMNKESAGALILVELAYNASPDDDVTNTRCDIVGHTISKNYFYKYAKIDASLSNAGDSETIRVGTSEYQNVNSSTTVSNNYFVEADGENEIITNKSKNNLYTNNTFRRSRGSLVLRHGSNATVDGNYFLGEVVDGTGGIRITDSDHIITNNYIQDCITVNDFAKWNNGITFIGGGDAAAVDCTTNDTSNGYQKSQNINLSNNTIINTNAPLFYNEDKGSNDPTGTVANNLIYFAANDPNLSDVISGDSDTAYNNLGTALTYTGNVYTGTELGVTNAGFSKETEITATANGEIFTFSGTGSTGKGAYMGAYTPTTDDMVGYGIGACFLNNLGTNISDGICTIVVGEYITVSSLPTLTSDAGSYDISVNANVSWTAVSNDSWISIDTNLGASGSTSVSVSVTKNEVVGSRSGTITFTQDPGGDDIVKTIIVTQEGVEITDLYNLINTGTGLDTDKVTVDSFSKEEVNGTTKFNYAKNTLDKNNSTVWAADDGAILAGDYKGDGEFIIYDLGDTYDLDLIQFSTTNKSDSFGFQIWASTTETDASDFTMILPASGDLLLTNTSTTDFNQFEINSTARYIKLLGYGRFNSAGDTRKSAWSAVGEIEFYGDLSVQSGDDSDGDGIQDTYDNCPNTSNPNQEDKDGDGIGDTCDDDIDGDGILNDNDQCPETPSGENVDANGCSDSQKDTDGDGVMDDMDNCPEIANENQKDLNGDGEGDLCDDDIDGDGIANANDLCPETPLGITVDANGCELLGSDNFTLEIISETCPDRNNGQLLIESQNKDYTFFAKLNGVTYEFSDTKTLDGLEPGDYEICIEVSNVTSPYCYNFTIEEGTTTSAKASTTKSRTIVEMLSGTAPYDVFINGQPVLRTMSNSFDVDTKHGDLVEVKTAIECEGIFQKSIQLFDAITLYPNPTEGIVDIAIPIDINKVVIEVYNNTSQVISKKEYNVNNGNVQLDLSNNATGVYQIRILLDKPISLSIIKQ